MQVPVLVDLDVSEVKVTGTATGMRSKLDRVKNMALSEALRSSQADVIVDPVYVSEVVGNKVTVTVTGYPAVYKNFRAATEGDVPLLETGVLKEATVSKVVTEPEKKGQVGLIVAGIIVVGSLLTLLFTGSL